MRNRILALCAIALLVVTATSCGSDKNSSDASGSAAGATPATFVLSEWKITLDGAIPAGQATVKIDNQGGEEHELVIVAAKNAAELPKKVDGSVDEDKIAEVDKVGESDDIAGRSSATNTFSFAPGTYVAFCNIVDDMGPSGSTMTGGGNGQMSGGSESGSMPMGESMGHVHFAQGMYMTFTVK